MCPGFNLIYANNTGSLRYVHATLYYADRSVKASALTFGAASGAGVIPRSSIGGEEVVSDMRVGRIDEQSSGAASATSVARPNMLRVYQQGRERVGHCRFNTNAEFRWMLDSDACYYPLAKEASCAKSATSTTSSSRCMMTLSGAVELRSH